MTNRPSAGGRRVLVVEDEALIGLALSELVEDEGCAVCGPFTRSDQAIAWLEGGETADLAIVDHILRDGPFTNLVRLLKARGIPFVIYSGNVQRADMSVELQQATWLEKPGRYAELCETLAGVRASEAA